MLHGHCQLTDVGTGLPAGAIVLGAALEAGEQPLGPLLVAVYLPQARALKVAGTVVDEALHVLRRVAEKQPHLVGELTVLASFVCLSVSIV